MVRRQILEFGKTTAVYGLGNILNKITAFLLIPVYVKYLSLAEVGSIALIELLESFLILFLLSGLIQSIWKRLKNAQRIEKNKIVFSGWVGLLCLAFFLFLVLFKYKHYLALFLGLNTPEFANLVTWILLGIFCQLGGQFLLFQLQFENRPVYYITFSISQLILTLVLTIYLTVFQKMGLHGIIYAKVFVTLSAFIYSSLYLIKSYFCLPSIKVFRQLIIFGFPLIFLGLATPILTLSDRFFLNMFVPLSMIGIYSINYKFGMLINMFLVVPLQRSLLPMIYKQGLQDELQPIYKDTLFYYSVIGCFIILGITFFIRPVIAWISSAEYLEATYIVPLVAAAYLISGFRPFFTPLVALKDRTACLLGTHGMIACGGDLKQAMWRAGELEALCQQYHLACQLGKPHVLTSQQIKEVRERMETGYGVWPKK